jgi:hypothetical protein
LQRLVAAFLWPLVGELLIAGLVGGVFRHRRVHVIAAVIPSPQCATIAARRYHRRA